MVVFARCCTAPVPVHREPWQGPGGQHGCPARGGSGSGCAGTPSLSPAHPATVPAGRSFPVRNCQAMQALKVCYASVPPNCIAKKLKRKGPARAGSRGSAVAVGGCQAPVHHIYVHDGFSATSSPQPGLAVAGAGQQLEQDSSWCSTGCSGDGWARGPQKALAVAGGAERSRSGAPGGLCV